MKVTLCPKTGLVVDGVSVVVELDFATVTVTTGEVLAAKFESPEYWAVIELLATGRVVTFRVALPVVPSGSVPREVEPLRTERGPVGVGDPVGPVTVAVERDRLAEDGEAGLGVTTVWLASSSVKTTELLLLPVPPT